MAAFFLKLYEFVIVDFYNFLEVFTNCLTKSINQPELGKCMNVLNNVSVRFQFFWINKIKFPLCFFKTVCFEDIGLFWGVVMLFFGIFYI